MKEILYDSYDMISYQCLYVRIVAKTYFVFILCKVRIFYLSYYPWDMILIWNMILWYMIMIY